jgi:predicted Zn-dependent protease
MNTEAMAGGEFIFYSGILPVRVSISGLATVPSHEIVHVVAQHHEETSSEIIFNGIASTPL